MSAYILDTSVTIAWYLPERFSESAREWQSRLLDGSCRFIVPGFHYWEFSNVLRTLIRREEISSDLAASIWELHLQAPLTLLEPERELILNTALRFDATTYDAVFIQLCLSTRLPLITAERKTRNWVSQLGERVISVSA